VLAGYGGGYAGGYDSRGYGGGGYGGYDSRGGYDRRWVGFCGVPRVLGLRGVQVGCLFGLWDPGLSGVCGVLGGFRVLEGLAVAECIHSSIEVFPGGLVGSALGFSGPRVCQGLPLLAA
jgi:hypothetical protein